MTTYRFTVMVEEDQLEKNEIIDIDDYVLNQLSDEGKQEFIEDYLEKWAGEKIVTHWEEI